MVAGGAIILEPGIRGSAQFSAQSATSLASSPSNPEAAGMVHVLASSFFPLDSKSFLDVFLRLPLRHTMFCSPT